MQWRVAVFKNFLLHDTAENSNSSGMQGKLLIFMTKWRILMRLNNAAESSYFLLHDAIESCEVTE
jgi:hypothetical protein